ncbi:putative RNA-binding protein Luc7-like 1 [Vitis vinifera]|uniref:Putative RNA-binding protein Luc7-like 1 n=2 Tax=Magnoliopsida TaxID=3398 RepID=A0A438CS37_VITVI|nr:putative RNA-binding protein Luc7-like 1 [Vitis vinifera]
MEVQIQDLLFISRGHSCLVISKGLGILLDLIREPHATVFQSNDCRSDACFYILVNGYEEAKAKGVHNYDRDLEDVIDRLIVECDRKIARALKRLEDEDAKAAIAISVSEVTQTPEVLELSKQIKEKLKEADQFDLEGKTDSKIRALEVVEELRTKRADKQSMLLLDAFNKDRASLPQPLPNPPPLAPLPVLAPDPRTQEMINEKLKKAEDLGEQGMIDEAQKALEEAEALKKLAPRQEPVLDSSKYTAADVRILENYGATILYVDSICEELWLFQGSELFSFSCDFSDRRLADHFGGKLHLGYMQIREKLAELQEERNKSRKVDRHENDRRSKERSRDRDREASKDRADSRERGRTMIVGAEIVIGTMIVIVDMIGSVTEILTAPEIMIQEVDAGHAHGLGNAPGTMIAPGIMIVTGVMIDTRSGLVQLGRYEKLVGNTSLLRLKHHRHELNQKWMSRQNDWGNVALRCYDFPRNAIFSFVWLDAPKLRLA